MFKENYGRRLVTGSTGGREGDPSMVRSATVPLYVWFIGDGQRNNQR